MTLIGPTGHLIRARKRRYEAAQMAPLTRSLINSINNIAEPLTVAGIPPDINFR